MPMGSATKGHEDRPSRQEKPRLWGKLRKRDDGVVEDWLSLIDHCTDVASVFRCLCGQRLIARSLARAAGQPLTSAHFDRLAVLAFLHDIGKCNHGFQAKAEKDPVRTAGHVRELGALIHDADLRPRFRAAVDYSTLATWFDDPEDALPMLLASASHHGKPIELDDTVVHRQKPLWLAANGIDPLADMASVLRAARETFAEAFETRAPSLSATPALQHRFAGLVMLADWLGSHAEGFFPFHHERASRIEFAREAAQRAVKAVGLDLTDERSRLRPDRAFTDLFPFPPTALQASLFQPKDSAILIAESETGSGKTEAALGDFFRLFARGEVDSLYFALPTRVAAREIYERVLAFTKRVFGDEHPPVVLAVPGYSQVDGDRINDALPIPAHLWQDDSVARRLERAWTAERPKRFLAAPIAVGTIDQALLSVMQVNHAHLRAVCLERALLVVDEVHASDTYMRGLLRALLDHHRLAGGRALLLSATLGSEARTELLTPLSSMLAVAPLKEASAQPYPSVTDSEGRMTALKPTVGGKKRVQIEPVAHLSTPARIVPALADAIAQGARVLVIVNTVARVTELLRAAEANGFPASAGIDRQRRFVQVL